MKGYRMSRLLRQAKGPVLTLLALPAVCLLSACYQPAATTLDAAQRTRIEGLASLVSEDRLRAELSALFAAPRHLLDSPENVEKARLDIKTAFLAAGFEITEQAVSRQKLWNHVEGSGWAMLPGPFTMYNIIADKAGTDPSLRPVLVTAHYDTVPNSPGADDNGSGCEGALEIARVLGGANLRRDLRFVIFCFEEDELVGSYAYVKSLNESQLPDSVFNLEMIGYTSPVEKLLPLAGELFGMPSTGDFIAFFGSSESRPLVLDMLGAARDHGAGLKTYAQSADANLQSNPLLTPLLVSDHTAFWSRGVPALFITDTGAMRGESPYHTAYDTPDTIDFEFMTSVVKSVVAAVAAHCVVD
ncbi:MAG: M28 family peptidase [Spirochaetota bacterium]